MRIVIFLLISMNTLAAMSIDIYLPSLPAITAYFNTSYSQAELTISLFMLGFGLSQIVYGPLSDRFGRRPIIFFGLGIYIVSTVICGFSASIHILTMSRIIQAIGACGVTVTSIAIVRDVFKGTEVTKILAYLTMVMGCIPVLAPILGSYLAYWFGWRSAFVFLTIFSIILTIVAYFKLPETNKFLDKFAIQPQKIIRNYQSILSNPQYRVFVLCSIFSFVALFSFVANSPYYVIELGKASSRYFSFLFAANALSLIFGGMLTARFSHKTSPLQLITRGSLIILVGGILMIAQMLIMPESIISFIGSMMLCTFGIALVMPAAMSGCLALFPEKAGSASAMTGCLRFLMASFVAYLVSSLQIANPLSLAIVIVGSAVIIFVSTRKERLSQRRPYLNFSPEQPS